MKFFVCAALVALALAVATPAFAQSGYQGPGIWYTYQVNNEDEEEPIDDNKKPGMIQPDALTPYIGPDAEGTVHGGDGSTILPPDTWIWVGGWNKGTILIPRAVSIAEEPQYVPEPVYEPYDPGPAYECVDASCPDWSWGFLIGAWPFKFRRRKKR